MSFSQTDLDAINAAIASGARRVRFQTHEAEYNSLTELLKARDLIKAEVEGSTGGRLILTEYQDGK